MALGDPYASLPELQLRLGSDSSVTAARGQDALSAASRLVEKHCRRQFNKVTSVSARSFRSATAWLANVDDFHTVTGLIVETDGNDDGTFETAWVAADFQLEPLNGVVDGLPGWPWCQVRAVGAKSFPGVRRPAVRVTAQWGWVAVPAPVKEVTLIVAEAMVSKEPANVISESIDGYLAAYSGLGGGMTSPFGKLDRYQRKVFGVA